jgi:predicted dehydrogenase
MNERLKAGIIGGGFMAEIHSRAVRAAGHEVVGVSSSTPERAAVAAERLNIGASYPTAQALVSDPAIDVIHICTPNRTHVELARLAIGAGKSVVCEKPLATSLADAAGLVELADAVGVGTAVPFVYRFYPVIREIRARIAAGEGGELVLLHGSYLQDWLAGGESTNWRVDTDLGGTSRAFADVGVHWCDLMEFATGHRIVRVNGTVSTIHRARGAEQGIIVGNEDISVVLFETDLGAKGSLTVSQVSMGRKNRLWFSFDGTNEAYEFNQEHPDTFWIGGVAENRIVARGAETLRYDDAQRLLTVPSGHPQGYQDSFNSFVSDAYRSFAGGTVDGLPTFRDGLRAAAITSAVMETARTGQWVDVPAFAAAVAT